LNRRISRISLSTAAVAATLISTTAVASAAHASAPTTSESGAVYVLGNQTSGNSVLVYNRAADGTLTSGGAFATGGTGTGGGLGSQNAVIVDRTAEHVYAVNAGSDSITSFAVTPTGLQRLSTVPSGGDEPVSVSVHGNRLYALNAGGAGNVTGFKVDNGRLAPLANSTSPLSGTATAGPAQVSITPDGNELIVTEKATQTIDVYRLNDDGMITSHALEHSEGATPFGFGFTGSGDLAVTEAGPSAVTTYHVRSNGLMTLAKSVADNQAAACWLVVTDDGQFAYVGNGGGSQSVSSYTVGSHGSLSLLDSKSATAAGGVTDIALSSGSKFLYARLGDGTVGAYAVQQDGSLVSLPVGSGLPDGAAGIAAR
jgi:6-phosphogluconolactonase (cycloisomerase 2 family)